MSRLLYH